MLEWVRNHNIKVYTFHDMISKVMITLFSFVAERNRDLISLRTKEASGVKLSNPKGVVQKSKFDVDWEGIEDLLALGLSVRKIVKLLGYRHHSALNPYVKKRNESGWSPRLVFL